MSEAVVLLQPEDCLPAELPCLVSVSQEELDRVPTDEEAQAALRSIGAKTSVEAVRAMQTVGVWAAKLKIPQIEMTRTMQSFEEIDMVKDMAKTLMEAASGKSEMGDVTDPELALGAMKALTNALMIQERMSRLTMQANQQSQPPVKTANGKNKLRPVNHFHVHNQPATA